MDVITIQGPTRLEGVVKISGAKNASLPILAATILAKDECVLTNVPRVSDVYSMIKILKNLGARVKWDDDALLVDTSTLNAYKADYEFVSTMRASICLMGPLLARFGKAHISMPGGCVIGPRPIDLHIKGLRALGASIELEHGYVVAETKGLKGHRIYLGGPFGSSVLATANVMMASVIAHGKTELVNAACEPEIVDLGIFLKRMGAKIEGLGSPVISITGVKKLKACKHEIVADRIEAGTYMLAAAITKGDVTLKSATLNDLGALTDKLITAGVQITERKHHIRVKARNKLKPISITTHAYPGFPTDLQAQMTALMCVTPGISVITEKIFPERFMHVSELGRMGANIRVEGPSVIVSGTKALSGAPVMASDLRASACLILAGLAARGTTEVSRVYHLDRGYEDIEKKLNGLGANINRVKR